MDDVGRQMDKHWFNTPVYMSGVDDHYEDHDPYKGLQQSTIGCLWR